MKFIPAIGLAAAAFFLSAASADVIVTKDGSTINGKILGIDAGKIQLSTDFAGKITISQSEVESITTEDPIYLSLENGTTVLGPVTTTDDQLIIESNTGTVTTSVDDVTETWAVGQRSPTVIESERKWGYQAAFDLTGKSGNKEATGFATDFRATLKGPDDKLELFARANYSDTDGVKSADQARGGIDYSNKFGNDFDWYVRTEFGYDTVKDIEQMFTVAGGFGKTLTDTDRRNLHVRGGIGYLFESYDDLLVGTDASGDPIYEMRPDASSASLDLGLTHKETFTWGTLVNRTTFTPTIEDFGNFRVNHDSSIDLPLKAEKWSVRTGVNFDYDSEADLSDKDELDTTYYVRMVLKWL